LAERFNELGNKNLDSASYGLQKKRVDRSPFHHSMHFAGRGGGFAFGNQPLNLLLLLVRVREENKRRKKKSGLWMLGSDGDGEAAKPI
jgi:hypothetical protein